MKNKPDSVDALFRDSAPHMVEATRKCMSTTPNTRMFVTGKRYVTPDGPGILGDDPRWLTAEFEEVIAVTDLETLVPSHWKQTSGPTVPRPAVK